jgi:hypothetical protein
MTEIASEDTEYGSSSLISRLFAAASTRMSFPASSSSSANSSARRRRSIVSMPTGPQYASIRKKELREALMQKRAELAMAVMDGVKTTAEAKEELQAWVTTTRSRGVLAHAR